MDYQTIYNKIQNGAYKPTLPYVGYDSKPKKPEKPVVSTDSQFFEAVMQEYDNTIVLWGKSVEEWEERKRAYQEDVGKHETEYYNDCVQLLIEAGATRKQAEKAYSYAYEHGHAYGHTEVLSHVHDLCDIWSED